MIETVAARELVDRLRQVEERLERLLTSGWRQARSEAEDLRQEADLLAEAGLPELAARVRTVAEANDPGEALQAIALATNACRLLRVRLPGAGVPDGWAPLTPARPKAGSGTDTLVPISRLLLDGREVWACAHPPRNQWILLELPFPAEEPAPSMAPPPARGGLFSRLRRQMDRVLGSEAGAPAPWMHHLLRGRLVWRARYPLGADRDVSLCTLEQPAWETAGTETVKYGIHAFYQTLTGRILISGALVFPSGGGFRLMELERDDPAALVWLDPSAAEAFGRAPTEKVWSIVWTVGNTIAPVAIVTRGERGDLPRLTHLIPGAPEDILVVGR